jgi:hypothetical protein
MLMSNERDGEHLVMAAAQDQKGCVDLYVASTYHERWRSRVASDHEVSASLEAHENLANSIMLVDVFL